MLLRAAGIASDEIFLEPSKAGFHLFRSSFQSGLSQSCKAGVGIHLEQNKITPAQAGFVNRETDNLHLAVWGRAVKNAGSTPRERHADKFATRQSTPSHRIRIHHVTRRSTGVIRFRRTLAVSATKGPYQPSTTLAVDAMSLANLTANGSCR